jgi:hypothetical protein
MKMAENGLLSAPNMAVGEPFNIGITAVQAGALAGMPGLADGNGGPGTGVHAARPASPA